MKLLSGAVLFFVLMGSTLLAFDQAGKETAGQLVHQWVPRCGWGAGGRKEVLGCA